MKPYSEDFRNAAVKAYLDDNGSYVEVAKIFNVHPKTLEGWVKMERNGEPQLPRGKGHRPRALNKEHYNQIAEILNSKPSTTLEELRKIIGVKT